MDIYFSDRNVTSNISTNVTVVWKTNYNPTNQQIYGVSPGGITSSFDWTIYIYYKSPESVQDIDITVIKVNENDGGIYKSKSTLGENATFDECSLLIITGKESGECMI